MHLQNAQLCICSSTHTATLGDSGGEVVFSISEKQVSTAASFALLPRFFFPLLTTEPHFVCMLGSCNSYIFVMELVLLPCTCSAQRRMHVCAHAHTCIWHQLNKRERGCVKEDRHRASRPKRKTETSRTTTPKKKMMMMKNPVILMACIVLLSSLVTSDSKLTACYLFFS